MPDEKRCTKCGETKPLTGFYRKDPKRLSAWCKPCQNAYRADWYTKHQRRRPIIPEGQKRCPACTLTLPVDAFDPNAARRDGRQVYCRACWPKYMKGYRKTETSRQSEHGKKSRHRKTPEGRKKFHARIFTMYAIRFGYLVRKPCEACGSPDTKAHHTQYDKPLDGIRWLCDAHHLEAHGGRWDSPGVTPTHD